MGRTLFFLLVEVVVSLDNFRGCPRRKDRDSIIKTPKALIVVVRMQSMNLNDVVQVFLNSFTVSPSFLRSYIGGICYFVSKRERCLYQLDLDKMTYEASSTVSGAFNRQPDQVKALTDDPENLGTAKRKRAEDMVGMQYLTTVTLDYHSVLL